MTVAVQFHYDFGSPNAYLSHLLIPEIEARTHERFEYVPVLLGGVFKATNNASPMVTLQGIKNKPEYTRLETDRFVRKHRLADVFRMNPHFPVNTLQIMRGAIAAQQLGPDLYSQYVTVVFRAMWHTPVKMDDPEVIRETLERAGLPSGRIIDGMQDPENKARLIANTEDSVTRGVFGSPSFFVGKELFFGKDRLREVEEEIESQRASRAAKGESQ
jgi:2-hydroxychromene-2-carboxylate isomerase